MIAASLLIPHPVDGCSITADYARLEIDGVDLQPCGGTHVANTADIGALVVKKIEKRSASTRRVVLALADG